jgi:ubiquinone/menaquinone biosynthesis C-methylase UbiE
MMDRLVEYLPPGPTRVLELGCGTGNLSVRLAAKLKGATLTLVDGSAEMIAVARSRLEQESPSRTRTIQFVTARFEDLDLQPRSFDLIVSSISLHHVVDKGLLYERLHKFLRRGGRFCFADQMRGEPESNHDVNWRIWLEFCALPGHCSAEEIESLLQHSSAHDHYTPLSEHFRLLARAGFGELDCVWRNSMWGIVTATAA